MSNGESRDPQVLQRELAVMRERLEGVARERDQLEANGADLRKQLGRTSEELQAAQKELGRLEEIRRQRDDVLADRDALRESLSALQASIDERLASAVRSAVEQAEAQHGETVGRLNEEIGALRQRVTELEAQAEGEGLTNRVTPTALAGHFAGVLDALGTGAPAAGKEITAALTGLEVEAKGVLEAPREGEEEPLLRTVEGGGINPDLLSTVRMSFRLLPHVLEPPQE
jgi:hypothetical protein